MCGIAGFCDFRDNLKARYDDNRAIAQRMGNVLAHRGPDAGGEYLSENVAFAHRRLIVIDPVGGTQPMLRMQDGRTYVLVYNGELYNTDEVRNALAAKGHVFDTTSDTEVLLRAYIEYGQECVDYFNGIFAFAVWDEQEKRCFLARDRFGVKPLFYTVADGTLIFGSEIKALFEYPGIKPVIDENGLCEIFGLGPARTPGCGVYRGIHELKPGHCARFDKDGLKTYAYWQLRARKHTDSYAQTVATVRELLFDAIKRQLVSDVPVCTLLSGGLDSSLVSAVSAQVLRERGDTLDTYSFEFADNSRYFKPSSFQPSEDGPFAALMARHINSRHRVLVCETSALITGLYGAVRAKDLPGMADVDSSLLYFCERIKHNHTVCLSGECADEIFGGYPWFRDPAAYETNAFPWSKNLDLRKEVLAPAMRARLPLDEYVSARYEESIELAPKLEGEDPLRARQREIAYLNIAWFMQTLLDRKDRMTMASGLEVRVPFADHRLVEYLYNVPWDMKYRGEQVKALLKDAAGDILPAEVLGRKKSPYPKTHHPGYEKELIAELKTILSDRYAPLHELVDTKALAALMESKSDLGRPWFGQLMAVPQMYAYLIEVNYWLERYGIEIRV
ncbi:MAG: asparagine synthase (glutamine-hydrolyzing) [Acetanaerobacterium sp.]